MQIQSTADRIAEIERQKRQQLGIVQSQADKIQYDLSLEAEQQRQSLRNQASQVESDYQASLRQAREAEKVQERQGFAGPFQPKQSGTYTKELSSKYQDALSQYRDIRAKVDASEVANKADIQKQLDAAKADLESQASKAIKSEVDYQNALANLQNTQQTIETITTTYPTEIKMSAPVMAAPSEAIVTTTGKSLFEVRANIDDEAKRLAALRDIEIQDEREALDKGDNARATSARAKQLDYQNQIAKLYNTPGPDYTAQELQDWHNAIRVTPDKKSFDFSPLKFATAGIVAVAPAGMAVPPAAIAIGAAAFITALAGTAYVNRDIVNEALGNAFTNAGQNISAGLVTVKGASESTLKSIQEFTNTQIQPFFEKVVKPRIENIRESYPISQQKNEIEKFIGRLTLPNFEGVGVIRRDIQDIILSNPKPDLSEKASNLMKAITATAEATAGVFNGIEWTKKLEANSGVTPEQWAKVEQAISAGRENIKVTVNRLLKDIGIASNAALTRAITELQSKQALLNEARQTYVASLNPTPMLGNAGKDEIAAYSASQLALTTGMVQPEPGTTLTEFTQQLVTPTDIPIPAKSITKTDVNPSIVTLIGTATSTVSSVKTNAVAGTQADIMTHPITGIQIKTPTQALTKTQIQAQAMTQALPKTATATQVATQARTIAKTMTGVQSLTRTLTRTATKEVKSVNDLTPSQKQGSVAWKQGFIYILIYPPYGNKNVLYSKKPFEGVTNYSGLHSAYRSLILKGGKMPGSILRDMGIMDIQITSSRGVRPTMRFKRDVHQKTNYSGMGKIRR